MGGEAVDMGDEAVDMGDEAVDMGDEAIYTGDEAIYTGGKMEIYHKTVLIWFDSRVKADVGIDTLVQ